MKFSFLHDKMLFSRQITKHSIINLFNLKSATIIQYTIKGRFMSR